MILLFGKILNQEIIWDVKTCEPCECYWVFCNVIKDADIDCEDSYKSSCDRKRYYLKNDQCNEICDCCLEGKCKKWTDYFCFIYKGFEFLAGIFFLCSSLNLLLLGILHKNFHGIKRKFNKAYFQVKENKIADEEAINEEINKEKNN